MKLSKENSGEFKPYGTKKNITRMCFAAHFDDIEFMASHGVMQCFGKEDEWFCGVVLTDGAGSPRSGLYADYTDEQMKKVRVVEQRKAAFVGEYGAMYNLDYTSAEVKGADKRIVDDIVKILKEHKPKYVYTHNFADKHDTHCATALRVIEAIRSLPRNERPEVLYGCECWRGLDWLCDDDKVLFDVSGHPNMLISLSSVFDSQITGGKRYDLACDGRRLANATFFASHSVDEAERVDYAIDMSELISSEISPSEFMLKYIDNFKNEVKTRLSKLEK